MSDKTNKHLKHLMMAAIVLTLLGHIVVTSLRMQRTSRSDEQLEAHKHDQDSTDP